MIYSISEELTLCGSYEKDEEKIAALQNLIAKRPNILILLRFALDPAITWLVPSNKIDYKPSPPGFDNQAVLYIECGRRLYIFVDQTLKMPLKQREILFIQTLEACSSDDAELLHDAKDKKINIKGLPVKIIKEALPNQFIKEDL